MRVETRASDLNNQRKWYSMSDEGRRNACVQSEKFFERIEDYMNIRDQQTKKIRSKRFQEVLSIVANAMNVM